MSTSVDARIMDYNGLTVLASSAVDSDELGVGTFALKDNRDSKDYLVRRLADGECWMVQNLDLELADYAGHNTSNYPNKVLTPANTDLAELGVDYWDPSASANQRISQFSSSLTSQDFLGFAKGILGTTVATTKQFQDYTLYDGDHFWGSKCTPTPSNATTISSVTAVSCDTTLAASAIMNNVLSEIPRSYSNTTSADNSTGFRYVPTKWDTGATTSYGTNAATATTSSFTPTARGTSSDGNAEGGYFGNMYIGHYYNWYAATAESGTYAQSSAGAKTVDSSICPAGWRLPVNSGIDGTSASGSWGNLIGTTYGLITTEGTQTANNNPFGSTTESSLRMHELPLSIPFTGSYNWQNGNLDYRGAYGNFWSSTPRDNIFARNLYFNSTRVNPQDNIHKVYGFTVRCVNKGSNQETVVSTCAANSICYNSNGGSGSMDNQSVTAAETPADTSAMLTAPSFTRTGYAFAGWSTSSTGYGTTYGPNETVTVGDLSSGGLQLYAKWIKSSGTMQEFTATQCSTMKEHEVIALTDNRDGNTYSVAKLKDGNCWMTSNLALNLAEFAGTQLLTPDNTDLNSSEAITRGYWDPGESTKEKWTTTYVAELDARNLTRDFKIGRAHV